MERAVHVLVKHVLFVVLLIDQTSYFSGVQAVGRRGDQLAGVSRQYGLMRTIALGQRDQVLVQMLESGKEKIKNLKNPSRSRSKRKKLALDRSRVKYTQRFRRNKPDDRDGAKIISFNDVTNR